MARTWATDRPCNSLDEIAETFRSGWWRAKALLAVLAHMRWRTPLNVEPTRPGSASTHALTQEIPCDPRELCPALSILCLAVAQSRFALQLLLSTSRTSKTRRERPTPELNVRCEPQTTRVDALTSELNKKRSRRHILEQCCDFTSAIRSYRYPSALTLWP